MKETRLKNKINSKTGLFQCGGFTNKGCGRDVGIGCVSKGVIYCKKCFEKIKGVRDSGGNRK